MELYGGRPPHFQLEGMLDSPRIEASQRDLLNYFYRGMGQLMIVAMCFKLPALVDELMEFRGHFKKEIGLEEPASPF